MRVRAMVAVLTVGCAVASTAAAGDPELGKKVFTQRCAVCHGADGKGNAQMEEKLKVKIPALAAASAKNDAELVKFLSEGKPPMPSFSKLSKDELNAVIDYAKKLAKGNQ